jgi:hypothetical protein
MGHFGGPKQHSDLGQIGCLTPHPGIQKADHAMSEKWSARPLKKQSPCNQVQEDGACLFLLKGLNPHNPKSKTINAEYVKKFLSRFLVVFRQKRPIMSSKEWFLHWDKVPLHTTASVQQFLVAN